MDRPARNYSPVTRQASIEKYNSMNHEANDDFHSHAFSNVNEASYCYITLRRHKNWLLRDTHLN